MSKELEVLKRIDERNYLTEREHREFYKLVEQALQRLEEIDNSNPSEVLKCLEEWYGFLMADNDITYSNSYENETEYNRRKETIYKQFNQKKIKQKLKN